MKALTVIRREYFTNVRRRSFIISTILVPVLMSLFFGMPVMLAMFEPQQQFRLAVVDETGRIGDGFIAALTDTLKDGRQKYLATLAPSQGAHYSAARDSCVALLQGKGLNMVIAIPAGVLDGEKASYITRQDRNFNVMDRFEDALSDAVLKERLAAEGLDYARVRQLTTNVELEMNQLTKAGGVEKRSFISEYGLVFFFVMVLYSAILQWGMTIARSITEEKQSRIIEVLLSTLTSRDLMLGKLIGVGLAGMTQLLIWAVVGLAITSSALPAIAATAGAIHVSPVVFLFFAIFFVLGFMLYAAMFMVVGAVSSTDQDVQQMQTVVMLPMLVPLMSLMLFMQNPNGGVAVGMSLIPVFTPLVMQARIALLMPPTWQIALGIALMLITIYFAVTFAARVFRVGILMHGKRPSLREMVHWYRMAR
ncbi:MAG TPA: ABC transporter permease [Candidatus Krumholzibacteria bacterium]